MVVSVQNVSPSMTMPEPPPSGTRSSARAAGRSGVVRAKTTIARTADTASCQRYINGISTRQPRLFVKRGQSIVGRNRTARCDMAT